VNGRLPQLPVTGAVSFKRYELNLSITTFNQLGLLADLRISP
jgi:hypothetical protein